MIKKEFAKTGKVCKTTFSLPKEAVTDAQEVVLLGEFNNWNTEKPVVMKKQKDGSFATTLDLEIGRAYQFRYLINGNVWENDWAADDYVPSVFGVYNSVVVVSETVAPVNGKSNGKAAKAPAKKAEPKAVAANPAEKVPPPKAAPAAKKETVKKAAPAKSAKDDLTKIEGIGPKIAELLNGAGIVTFDGLAKADTKTLKGVLENAGPRFKMHDPATWMEQAKLAAAAQWEKLAKLQEELKGGKRK